MHPLSPLFSPQGVAVLGASENPNKLGSVLLNNLVEYGYAERIYPVNPRSKEIMGYPAYAAVSEIPHQVDVALISIPDAQVVDAIRDCVNARVKGAVILSSGFGEKGEQGKAVEASIASLAREAGVRVIGPNCMGVYNPHASFNGTYFWDLPRTPGKLGVLSQSGAYGGMLFRELKSRGLGVSKFVSIGNQLDLTHADGLEFLAEDPETQVVALVIEELRDGRRFVEVGRRMRGRKPLIAFKVGRTEAGRRAASSHTGSIAGRAEIYGAVFKGAGVIAAADTEEFFDLTTVLDACASNLPSNDGAAIITISGGPSVAASDACEEHGLEVPRLSEATVERLKSLMADFAAPLNPVDMTPQTDPANYRAVVDTVLDEPGVGGLIAINVGLDHELFGEAFASGKEKHGKPIVACTLDTPKIDACFAQAGIPVFPTPERAVKAYRGLVRYRRIRQRGA